ncbi:MAG: diguanylate cyclase, partial [Gammaproteobacteria bacterium]
MSAYERFEQVVAMILTFIIAVVIVFSLGSLAERVFTLLILGAVDPIEPHSFQVVFGMIMTVLIAMEFKHSILKVAARRESIIQVRTVVLIAILAISRKFIILDAKEYSASTIAALAGSLLALGIVYWLVRNSDR